MHPYLSQKQVLDLLDLLEMLDILQMLKSHRR